MNTWVIANRIRNGDQIRKTNRSDFGEDQLNNLCYRLMASGDPEGAVEVCKLNVELFPESFNPYDSLGEAYMTAGETALAIQSYARSLELNPENTNAVGQLMQLTGVGD